MANYKITFRKSAAKELDGLPKIILRKIINRIQALADDPRPIDCEKLSGEEYYRIRQGNFRIVYSIQDSVLTVLIIKISHRKDIYKKQ